MVNFRQVKITNEAQTESIELNDLDGYLMTSPTGFGIYRTSEYITVGNQRVQTNNRATFQKITMNVLILGERSSWEIKYANLRDFISRNLKKGFRLYYTPHEETRYIKCDINIVDKTEKDYANLPIKLEIQPLTLWLTDDKKDSVQQSFTSENSFTFNQNAYNEYSATFDLVNDYTIGGETVYAISFIGNSSTVATVINNGMETSPLKIRLYGLAVNPRITLSKYGNGSVLQEVVFRDLTIQDGYYLEIDSEPTNTHIELVNISTGERFDRESWADIESNMYLILPVGKYNISVEDESGTNKCYAEIFYSNQYYGG